MEPYSIANCLSIDARTGLSYKKGIKLYFYILSLFILLTSSCVYDPPRPFIEICNKTYRNLTIELFFDKENYKEYWSEDDFRTFLIYSYAQTGSGNGELISADTVNLIQRYSLLPNSHLRIDGWGDKDESILFNKIKVIKDRDTMIYGSIAEIKKSFTRINGYLNRLEIN
ncbi:MAG: hypothetical protein J7577_04645 [Sphingobacteriaceae bacterium]|nr:hypothetical protein [Sphingobacteriaceae bacterium]